MHNQTQKTHSHTHTHTHITNQSIKHAQYAQSDKHIHTHKPTKDKQEHIKTHTYRHI